MSAKQKESLIDQLFKVGNILSETQAWFLSVYSFLRAKYRGINSTTFDNVWHQFGVDTYLEKVKEIYSSHFSEEELQAILNFWVSPVGHKLSNSQFTSSYRQFAIDWATQVEQSLQHFVKQESLDESQKIQAGVKE